MQGEGTGGCDGLPAGPASADPAPLAVRGCHGPQGLGIGAVARLAGRDAAELGAILRADQRPGTIMNRIARGYTEAALAAVSAYFAAVR
jgi:sulfide dehydrogenase cytochrome subunit